MLYFCLSPYSLNFSKTVTLILAKNLSITMDCNVKIKLEKFSKGQKVEVTSDEKGFHSALFTTIIVKVKGKDKFLVDTIA